MIKLTVRNDKGRAQLVLMHDKELIGMASMAWSIYKVAAKMLLEFVMTNATATLEKSLGTLIYKEAIRASGDDPERAAKKIAEMGWTQPDIERFAKTLAYDVVEGLVKHLPEHQ